MLGRGHSATVNHCDKSCIGIAGPMSSAEIDPSAIVKELVLTPGG